jgi:hypothetical protein
MPVGGSDEAGRSLDDRPAVSAADLGGLSLEVAKRIRDRVFVGPDDRAR